jgi:hypothetical protein
MNGQPHQAFGPPERTLLKAACAACAAENKRWAIWIRIDDYMNSIGAAARTVAGSPPSNPPILAWGNVQVPLGWLPAELEGRRGDISE